MSHVLMCLRFSGDHVSHGSSHAITFFMHLRSHATTFLMRYDVSCITFFRAHILRRLRVLMRWHFSCELGPHGFTLLVRVMFSCIYLFIFSPCLVFRYVSHAFVFSNIYVSLAGFSCDTVTFVMFSYVTLFLRYAFHTNYAFHMSYASHTTTFSWYFYVLKCIVVPHAIMFSDVHVSHAIYVLMQFIFSCFRISCYSCSRMCFVSLATLHFSCRFQLC